jgi:UMF1 family MFS transporter
MKSSQSRQSIISWALYDWANSAFSLSVVTAFVPVLLAQYWNDGAASTVTTFRLGWANSLASLLVALLAPVVGAIADRAGRRKGLLLIFAALGVVMTGAIYFVAQGQWLIAILLYIFASIGFTGSNSLYDSLLVTVSAEQDLDRVSALGFAFGYLGGALLFTLNILMVANPDWFGLASDLEAARLAFLLVAIWWAVFSIPLLLYVREDRSAARSSAHPVADGLRQLRETLVKVRSHRETLIFLVAYWLYIDGVYTIIKMAVDYGLSQGLSMDDVLQAVLISNYIGFPAALAFGAIGSRFGAKRGIILALSVYVVATMMAPFISTETEFYGLAVAIGLVQGGVQSLSRSLFARLIPAGQTAEFFGFYNMLGKFAAILGPGLTGMVALVTGSQRIGILSIIVLFIAGLALLTRVRIRPIV